MNPLGHLLIAAAITLGCSLVAAEEPVAEEPAAEEAVVEEAPVEEPVVEETP